MTIYKRCKARWDADPSEITEAQLRKYVNVGLLTKTQYWQITGKSFDGEGGANDT